MTTRFLFGWLTALVLAAALICPQPAWAIGLEDAKNRGLVGEQANGYLGMVKPSAEVNALIADINAKRRQKYEEIARRNNTSVQVVEALAGKTAIGKTPPGQYVKTPSGAWVRK